MKEPKVVGGIVVLLFHAWRTRHRQGLLLGTSPATEACSDVLGAVAGLRTPVSKG